MATYGAVASICALLSAAKVEGLELVNWPDARGRTALHVAALSGAVAAARALVDVGGASMLEKDHDGAFRPLDPLSCP